VSEIIYPTPEKIIEYNLLAVSLIRVKKADKAEVLSKARLENVIEECKKFEGNVYDKATVLLRGIAKSHAFASGNRRTAFITTKAFLTENDAKFNIKDDPSQAKVLTGIREGYYSNEEIREWIENGKIREFKR